MKQDESKNLERALVHYKRSIAIQPNNLVLLLKMGKCYDRKREYNEAVQQYTKALLKDPANTSIMFKLGWAYLRAGQKEKGLVQMRRSIGGGETNIYNQIKLSEVLMRQDDVTQQKEAVDILNKTLKQNPDCIDAMVVLGRAYERLNDIPSAKQVYERAVAVPNCQNVSAFFYLGVLLDKCKEFDRAISMLKQCLAIDTENFGACIHLATLLANTGENKKAAKYFKHALRLNPKSVPANFGMGKILHAITGVNSGGSNVSQLAASIQYFKTVLELDPNYYKAHC